MTRVYTVLAQDFAYHDLDNLMIFFANHDHDRTGDVLRHDPARMKLAYALLATLRGIPQLYYGDEMMFCEKPGLHHDGSKRIDFPGGWEGDAVDLFTSEGRAAAGYTRDPRGGGLHPRRGLHGGRGPARLRPRPLPLAQGLPGHPLWTDAPFPFPEERQGPEHHGQYVFLFPL